MNVMFNPMRWKAALLIGATGGVVLSAADGGSGTDSARPNFIVLIADDLNDSVEGMGGHPQAITPNLDRMAAEGVRMQNAHCTVAICGPSRASMWTGMSPLRTGYYGYRQQQNNWRQFEEMSDAVTLMEYFAARGYAVMGTGKIFHNGHEDNSVFNTPMDGLEPSFGPAPWDGRGYFSWNKPEGRGHPAMPGDRTESYWGGFGPLSEVPEVDGWRGWMADWAAGEVGDPDSWRFRWESPDERDRMPDEISAQWAADKLRSADTRDDPFLMIVGFNRPHTPMYAPDEFFDLWDPAEIRLPPYLPNDLEDVPEILWKNPETGQRTHHAMRLPQLMRQGDATPEGGFGWWRRWVHAYLACTAFVDHQVGVILDALTESPHRDNTYVIFISDHGYHMGQKDFMAKTTIWEESTRVPMLWVGPDIPAGTETEVPVSLLDLYPTLVEFAGFTRGLPGDSSPPLDGASIAALLREPASVTAVDDRRGVLSHLAGPKHLEPHTYSEPAWNHHSIRTERYRYTLCSDGSEELYDLLEDPHAWNNRAGNPDYRDVQADLAVYLAQRLAAAPAPQQRSGQDRP